MPDNSIRFKQIPKYSILLNIRYDQILEYSNHRIFGHRIFDSTEYRISQVLDIPNRSPQSRSRFAAPVRGPESQSRIELVTHNFFMNILQEINF